MFTFFKYGQIKVEWKLLHHLKYVLMWCISSSCVNFLDILAQQSFSWFMQTTPDSMFFFFPSFFSPAAFPDLNKNMRLYNQGNSIWVRLKPQLYNRRADSALPQGKTWSFTLSTWVHVGVDENAVFVVIVKSRFVSEDTVIPRIHCFQCHCILRSNLPWCYHRAEWCLNHYHLRVADTVDVWDSIWLTGWEVVTSVSETELC